MNIDSIQIDLIIQPNLMPFSAFNDIYKDQLPHLRIVRDESNDDGATLEDVAFCETCDYGGWLRFAVWDVRVDYTVDHGNGPEASFVEEFLCNQHLSEKIAEYVPSY